MKNLRTLRPSRPALLFVLPWLALASCVSGDGQDDDPGDDAAPTLTLQSPTTNVEFGENNGAVAINYVDDDPDSVATTDHFADMDGDLDTTADQVVISTGRLENNGLSQDVTWYLDGVPYGTYRIFGRTTDGTTTVTDEAPGTVRVDAAPTVEILQVTAEAEGKGPTVVVQFTDNDPDSVAETTIWADGDGLLTTTSDQYEIATLAEADGEVRSAEWNTSGVTPGSYVIIAEVRDELNTPVRATGPGTVSLGQPLLAGWGGGTGDEDAHDVAVFSDGSFVIVGEYEEGLYFVDTFDQNEADEPLPVAPADEGPLFVARFDADGGMAWARPAAWGTESGEAGDVSVAALSNGSTVILGAIDTPVVFGLGTPEETTLGSDDTETFYLVCYDADGDLIWAREDGGASASFINPADLAATDDGGFVVAGNFQGPISFSAPLDDTEGGGFDLTSSATKMFLAWYDANGTPTFVRADGGAPTGNGPRVTPRVIALDEEGCLYVAGILRGAVTLGEGDPNAVFVSYEAPGGYSSPFLAKYAPDHTLAWATPEVTNVERAFFDGIAPLGDGSVVVTGSFEETLTLGVGSSVEVAFDSGEPFSGLIARYDAEGDLTWARQVASSTSHVLGDKCVLVQDAIVWTGYYYQDATFGSLVLDEGRGYENMFLVGYSFEGEELWARDYIGEGVEPHGLCAYEDGVLVVGQHKLGFELGVFEDFLFSIGTDNTSDDDFFYARIHLNGDL